MSEELLSAGDYERDQNILTDFPHSQEPVSGVDNSIREQIVYWSPVTNHLIAF